MNASKKLLQNQLKQLVKEPSGYFYVCLKDESNLYEWNVYIAGPPNTVYEGGTFKAQLSFPKNYPYEPPKMKFVSQFWHPNVYENGSVCISILHPPGEDEMSGERPEERWLPIHTPETILLSVISMLADPNCSSPANVDASVEFRNQPEKFANRIQALIEKSKKDVPDDFVMPQPVEKTEVDSSHDYYYDDADDVEYEMDDDDEFDEDDDDSMDYSDEDLSPLNEEEKRLLEEESQEQN